MGQLRDYTIISSPESMEKSKFGSIWNIPRQYCQVRHLKHKFCWFSVLVSPYIWRYTTCHKWASYASIPSYHHPNPNKFQKFESIYKFPHQCCQYVTSSINSFGFEGLLLWAHTYQDILHVINGPAARVYHHIIRIQI